MTDRQFIASKNSSNSYRSTNSPLEQLKQAAELLSALLQLQETRGVSTSAQTQNSNKLIEKNVISNSFFFKSEPSYLENLCYLNDPQFNIQSDFNKHQGRSVYSGSPCSTLSNSIFGNKENKLMSPSERKRLKEALPTLASLNEGVLNGLMADVSGFTSETYLEENTFHLAESVLSIPPFDSFEKGDWPDEFLPEYGKTEGHAIPNEGASCKRKLSEFETIPETEKSEVSFLAEGDRKPILSDFEALNETSFQSSPKQRGMATDPQSVSARKRRRRISTNMKTLQELIPNAKRLDNASLLEKSIEYVHYLHMRIEELQSKKHQ